MIDGGHSNLTEQMSTNGTFVNENYGDVSYLENDDPLRKVYDLPLFQQVSLGIFHFHILFPRPLTAPT